MKNIFFLVGERSADIHAAEVLKRLNKLDLECNYWGIGGSKMQQQGFEAIFPFEKFSIIGFAEVVKHLPFIRKVNSTIQKEFEIRKPDLIILLDYPGFNMRIAKLAHKMQIPVLYYISPQFWAWKKKRIFKMKKYCDKIAVIFPFEEKLYNKIDADAEFVGHPVCEEINFRYSKKEFAQVYNLNENKKWLGFIPGSRDIEIMRILPELIGTIIFLEVIHKGKFEFLISLADTVNENHFRKIIDPIKDKVKIIHETYDLMKHSDFIISKSGTSCLETAFIGTPEIVVYKISSISYFLAKFFINIDMIAMPNILLGKKIIPELIQNEANIKNITENIEKYLLDEGNYLSMKNQISTIEDKLGNKSASENVVKIILSMINETSDKI
ncbi:MAG: lipid-A-disaccharide synthase [Candidatus Cloacimonadota bacterium]|nr:lipid-A-disaccharide synthase [Candidatus Cloacimonadota bacterium]